MLHIKKVLTLNKYNIILKVNFYKVLQENDFLQKSFNLIIQLKHITS